MGGAIGAAAGGGGGQDQLLNATKQMQETQMSFNLQYLQLQSQMQHENRSYTAISNIMKTKHDTVKNSISNVR
jgi:ribulose kinase